MKPIYDLDQSRLSRFTSQNRTLSMFPGDISDSNMITMFDVNSGSRNY